MEAYTLLRCVAFLGMVVLSLAAAPAVPADPAPQDPIYGASKIRTLTCAKKCAISCALDLFKPAKFAACVGLCMTSCKIQDPPAPADVQATADTDGKPTTSVQSTSVDPTHACTRTCVSSMSKVMTTNTKLTMPPGTPAPAQPPANGT